MSTRLSALLALLVAACGSGGGEPRPAAGVVHLDLRLENGRSSAELLALERRLVREWTVGGHATADADLAPWTFVNAGHRDTKRGRGIVCRSIDYRPEDGVTHAVLRHSTPIVASEVNAIEVDLVNYGSGNATLRWRSPGAEGGLRIDVPTEKRAEVVTVTFSLAGQPGWRGQIEDLSIYPAWRGAQSFELYAIRFVSVGFHPGHQPLADFGADSADGGLVGFAGDERRTWVTDFGVPLVASVREVPLGGRVVVDTGLSPEQLPLADAVHFAVDVRAGGGTWEERAARSVPAAAGVAEARWVGLSLDLSDHAGGAVDLRFRGWSGNGGESGGELERARIWWGAPMVIGDLPPDRRPNVLLVTVDTLRTDAIGSYGGRENTPFLDAFAGDAILYEDAWTACNSTLPSHASILTGLDVPTHGVLDNRSMLAPEVRTLAQALRESGYHTAAAVSVHHLEAGYSGLGRGFDQYREVVPGALVDGAKTIASVGRWLEEWDRQGDRPFFLWVHLFDPHTPYEPPRDYQVEYVKELTARGGTVPPMKVEPGNVGRTRYTGPGEFLDGVTNSDYARFFYDMSVAYTDRCLRDLFGALDRVGATDATAIVLTADHGESLGENDVWFNHQMMYPPVMHVPLVLRFPGGPRGVRVKARASNIDIARTLVDYLHVSELEPIGEDLLRLARDGGERESRRVFFVHSANDQLGCRDDDFHVFFNRKEYMHLGPDRALPAGEVYLHRHAEDPGSERNLAQAETDAAARYRELLDKWFELVSSGRSISRTLSPAEQQRLLGLGYGPGGEDEDGED